MKPVPKHVASQYEGGARGFRAEKRRIVREMLALASELRDGCAFLPCGLMPVHEITDRLEILRKALSVKEWGR